MYFNVSQLLREHSGSSRAFEVDDVLPGADELNDSRLKGTVNLVRTDRGVWVSAVLDSDVACVCSRCVEEYRQPVRLTFEEEAFPLADDGEGPSIDENHTLDLTEAVTQYAALSLPMKPVCRDDCKGLCPNCAANLNLSTCKCDQTVTGARWGPLLDLAHADGPSDRGTN